MKWIDFGIWSVLGGLLLLSYGLLVFANRGNVSSLWFGVPKIVQYVAYVFWGLAIACTITYAVKSPPHVVRRVLVPIFLICSLGWSLALLMSPKKQIWVAVVSLVLVALAVLALFGFELYQKQHVMALMLLPLLCITVFMDATIWNIYYLRQLGTKKI